MLQRIREPIDPWSLFLDGVIGPLQLSVIMRIDEVYINREW